MVADVSHDAPFFTGLREKHVPVKSLGSGDVLEYHIRETYASALIPNQFWYQYDFTKQGSVLGEELRLDLPKGRAIHLRSEKLKPTVTEEGDRRIYTWKTSRTDPRDKTPPMLPGHVPASDVEVSSFSNRAEIGKWMADLYRDRGTPTPEIAAKAQQLTKEAKTEEDKIKALYNYVSLQFRYTGIALGPGRWRPHSAEDVLSNEFGDCKDKHTLLAAMVKAIGVTAYPVLVSSGRVLDAEVPSPANFDHVMTYIPRGKQPLWLDTTMETAPYGYIVFAMRDKQGLVRDGEPHLEAVTTREYESWEEFHADTTLSSDGTLDGELTREARGDAEMVVRGVFRRVGPGKYRDVVQSMSYASGFAGSVSDVVVSPVEDTSTPIKLKYHYNRKDFSDWENQRITLPMPPLGIPAISEEPEHAKDPIILGQPSEFRYYSRMKLPTGYNIALPQSKDLSRDFADYHVKYELEDGVLIAQRVLKVKKPIVKAEELDAY
jgi:transglutaminase-like putative cysteine protease